MRWHTLVMARGLRLRPAHPLGLGAGAGLLVLQLVTGCSHPAPERVVLLPQPDGRPSAVEVRRDGQRVLLQQPYATVESRGDALVLGQTSADDVAARYGALVAALPPRPQRFVVRFESNSNRLTAESQAVLAEVAAALGKLAAPEVVVTGHTDRVGSVEANDKLSLSRAESVRDLLVAAGLSARTITVAGRGEREPEVPTADEVAEPRNRRVEIKIR